MNHNKRIREAARALYFAGRWAGTNHEGAPIAADEQAKLWTELRDALEIPPGTATALGIGQVSVP